MGDGVFREMDELVVLKRGFRSKVDVAEEVCSEDQLEELKGFVLDLVDDW